MYSIEQDIYISRRNYDYNDHFKCKCDYGQFVHKGECVGVIEFEKWNGNWHTYEKKEFFSEQDGYVWYNLIPLMPMDAFSYKFEHLANTKKDKASVCKRIKIYTIYDSYEDLLNNITDFRGVDIKKDISTGETQIIQYDSPFCGVDTYSITGYYVSASFAYIDEKLHIRLHSNERYQCWNFFEGGKITLQLKNGKVISLTYTKNDGFILLDEDFHALCSSEICLIQVKFRPSSILLVYDKPEEISSQDFLFSANCFANLLKANNIVVSSTAESVLSAKESDPCYVYLMLDYNTGYYKIGISKRPKHREGTLQSEKPTIYMLANKCYPNRKIALAIEKALHETYKLEHVRGEWYNLKEKDVEDLKSTLS